MHIQALCNTILSNIREASTRQLPDYLWHYTDADGVHGILAENKIWLTHHRLLNDRSEGVLVREAMAPHLRSFGLDPEKIKEAVWDSAYVYCLSTKHDDLNQWRSYGSNGAGYAVGLQSRLLTALCTTAPTIHLLEIQYGTKHIPNLLDKILEQSKQHANGSAQLQLQIFIKLACILSLGVKDEAFCEESEWRLVQFDDDAFPLENMASSINPRFDIQFRIHGNELIPYTTLELPNFKSHHSESDLRVIVGPCPSKELRERRTLALDILKRTTTPFSVEHSKIPYLA